MKHADVLLTGGLGYLGSVLTERLIKMGYRVRVVDRLLYGDDALRTLRHDFDFEFVNCDVRDLPKLQAAIEHCESVVHLAAIVGDPACNINKELAWDINYNATLELAHVARKSNVHRMIFASSCSVYGNASGVVSEEARLNPLSLYAESRARSERELSRLAGEEMWVTSMRMGTLYGPSRRMRFDLVANLFAANAATSRIVTVEGGQQWRPFLHVSDAADAYAAALEATELNAFEIFNVGGDNGNHRIIDLAEVVKRCEPEVEVRVASKLQDHRNYNVSFKKIREKLGFRPRLGVRDGVSRILDAFKRGDYSDFPHQKYSNVETIKTSSGLLALTQIGPQSPAAPGHRMVADNTGRTWLLQKSKNGKHD